jgi:hypothetical protein
MTYCDDLDILIKLSCMGYLARSQIIDTYSPLEFRNFSFQMGIG